MRFIAEFVPRAGSPARARGGWRGAWGVVARWRVVAAWGLVAASAAAQEAADPPATLPAGAALVEWRVPKDASVDFGGRAFKAGESVIVPDLPTDRVVCLPLELRRPDQSSSRHELLLQAGWRVTFAALAPRAPLPELVLAAGHARPPTVAAFSPEGRWLLTASPDQTAILWNLANGTQHRQWRVPAGEPVAAALSANGTRAALLTTTGEASVWRAAGETPERVWDVFAGAEAPDDRDVLELGGAALAIHPVGDLLLCSGDNFRVAAWDIPTGRRVFVGDGHSGSPTAAAFNASGDAALTGGADKTAILWDVRAGKPRLMLTGPPPPAAPLAETPAATPRHAGPVRCVAISENGRLALTAANDQCCLWDASTGRLRAHFRAGGSIVAAALHADGTRVATALADDVITIWDIDAAEGGDVPEEINAPLVLRKTRELDPGGARVLAARFADGDDLVAVLGDGAVKRWRADQPSPDSVLPVSDGQVLAVAFHSAASNLAVARAHGAVGEFSWGFPHRAPRLAGGLGRLRVARALPSGDGWLLGRSDGQTLLCDSQGQITKRLRGHRADVLAVDARRDGAWAATGGRDAQVWLWPLRSDGGEPRALPSPGGAVLATAFAPDGARLAAASASGATRLWSVPAGDVWLDLPAPPSRSDGSPVSARVLAWLSNSRLVVGDDVGTLRFWDLPTGDGAERAAKPPARPALEAPAHKQGVACAAWDGSRRWLLTGGGDGVIKLWEVDPPRVLREFVGPPTPARSVALRPDGRVVASGGGDGLARLWDVATGDELLRVLLVDQGGEWLAATPAGLFEGSARGTRRAAFRVGDSVAPVERFYAALAWPGLFAAVSTGQRPLPDLAQLPQERQTPPALRVLAPAPGAVFSERAAALEIEVRHQGNGWRDARLSQNGAVLDASPVVTHAASGVDMLRYSVRLVEGVNEFTVSTNVNDVWKSEPVSVRVTCRIPPKKPRLHLLAVGVGDYRVDGYDLRFPAADARAVAELFEHRAGAFHEARVARVLTDERATREAIRRALAELAEEAEPRDTVVLFFAGHGVMLESRYFFLPHDFQRDGGDLARATRETGLAVDELSQFLLSCPALKRVIVLDTCASGGALKALAGPLTRGPDQYFGAIEKLNAATGSFVLAAAAANAEAAEPTELGHGALTYTLLAGAGALSSQAREKRPLPPPRGRELTVDAWFAYAAEHLSGVSAGQSAVEFRLGNSFPLLPLTEGQREE